MKRYNLRAVVNDVVLEVSSYYNNFKYRDQSVIRSMLLKKAIESQKFNSDVAAKLGSNINQFVANQLRTNL